MLRKFDNNTQLHGHIRHTIKNWTFRKISRIEVTIIYKGNQSWIFTGGTYAEAETPILWPPDPKSLFTGKDPDVGKDWGQEKRETGWHGWMASPTHLT